MVNFEQRGQDDRPEGKFNADISGFVQPERLRALQEIFDAVWLEVQTGSHHPTVALRNKIACCVAEYAGDAQLDADEIERAVRSALDAKPKHSLPTFQLTRYRAARRAA